MNMESAWNKISKSYQARYKIGYNQYYYGPYSPPESELKLLDNVKNKKVLELGSGAGQNSIYLALHGAEPTAYDISTEQIKFGKSLAKKAGVKVRFIVGSFEELPKNLKLNSFDLVVSSFAFQYHKSVASLNRTFRAVNQLLKSGGKIVISLDHPIKALGHWDDGRFIIDNYFDSETKYWNYDFPETGVTALMSGRFYTISDYINSVAHSGLKIERIIEPKPSKLNLKSNRFGQKSKHGSYSSKDPFNYDNLELIPGTLIIVATKP